jgi:hypothetical protein
METKHEHCQIALSHNRVNEQPLSPLEKALPIPYFFSQKGSSSSLLNNDELSKLSRISTAGYRATKQVLQQRGAQKLLTHVVLGEEAKAQEMLEASPSLLLIPSRAVDYSGRTIIAKPFQAAIGAGDKPMWEMMLPYFAELDPQELRNQFQAWFPHGIDDIPAAQLQGDYNAIALAIISDEDLGHSKIEQLRVNLTSQKEITIGQHFNLQHLVAAYQAYVEHFDALGNWDNRDLFWQKVIGFVQRQMTAYDAQVHCSGIQNVLDKSQAFSRSLSLYGGGELFPLRVNSGLGFDFGVFAVRGGARVGCVIVLREWVVAGGVDVCKRLCEAKTEALIGLRESLVSGQSYQRSA